MGRWCGDGDNERGGLCRMANGARHGQHGRPVPSVAPDDGRAADTPVCAREDSVCHL